MATDDNKPPAPLAPLQKYVPQLLRYIRQRSGETQQDLAKRIGVSNKTVSKAETGRTTASVGLLFLYLDAHQLTLDQAQKILIELEALDNATR